MPPIKRIPRDARTELPLSFAQQRLWFIDQLEPGNPAYNIPLAMRLLGRLDVEALEQALQEIVRRHEALRTCFAAFEGQPMQVIGSPQPWALPVVDLGACSEAEREALARKLAAEEALRPFDLARGPLLRVTLLWLGEEEHLVLLTLHHIVGDEWSLGVLVRELAALYEAFCQGKPSPLPELPIQYADFGHWQRQWLQGETLEAQLGYWRQRLGGPLPMLKLPFDRPRPAAPSARGALHSFSLCPEVSQALKALSRQEGVTLFMMLLAALQVLLYRYTGQEDILVGTDVANRNRLETEGLIGFFVNHLLLRTDLSGNPTFRALLKRVREVALGAYAHQDLPFDKLVAALQPERDRSPVPLFQVLFVHENPSMPSLTLPGLSLSAVKADLVMAKYDLTLFMGEGVQRLGGAWRYRSELFEAATIARLSGHYETLIQNIVADPDARLSRLRMHTEAERQTQAEDQSSRQQSRARTLRSIGRKAVDLTAKNLSESVNRRV